MSVKKIYKDIVTAAQEGKFSIAVTFDNDDDSGHILPRVMVVEKVEALFPGILVYWDDWDDCDDCDKENTTAIFDWSEQKEVEENPLVSALARAEAAEEQVRQLKKEVEQVHLADMLAREATQRAETAERKFTKLSNVIHNVGDLPNAYHYRQCIWNRYCAVEAEQ